MHAQSSKVPLQVPEGFEVTQYADDTLAHDIYSMTVDSKGRIVVSGKGYVRILIDSNNDGKAESFKQFANGPATGAQGMYFHGNDLFCMGDKGLIRYRDQNNDDKADGKPDLFLQLGAGGEHDAHAIQRGADGWWYFIAGNFAGISHHYATLKTSPITQPLAGAVVRLKPDLSGGEIVSDGFRNAYDFAFNGQGDLFVYDSDGERDVSLPWYRPTRLFQTLPASHAGWVSKSWKRPKSFIDMPPVVGSFGRGSPTGVCCYRHELFPKKYQGAIFTLDWTFGRLIALPLKEKGSKYQSKPILFMKGTGQFGFAPTDIVVGKEGALYVSVGGRGTQGGVYRIVPKEKKQSHAKNHSRKTKPKNKKEKLFFCLNALQPLSSWSRAQWVPLAKEVGRKPFLLAATHQNFNKQQRIRAIEIATELFGGLDDKTLLLLSKEASPSIRARAVWSYGRSHTAHPRPQNLLPFLEDQHPLVNRFALEALLGIEANANVLPLLPAIAKLLKNSDKTVRKTTAAVGARLPLLQQTKLKRLAVKQGLQAELTFALGTVLRSNTFHKPALETGLKVFRAEVSNDMKQDAIRLMQLALGDVGPRKKKGAPAFESYQSRIDLSKQERFLDSYRALLAEAFPTKSKVLNDELLRLLAMLTPYNTHLLNKILQQIDNKSHPVDDIHRLFVASKIPVDRNALQSKQTARALVLLGRKIKLRALNQDSNWQDRITELYKELFKHDPLLPSMIITQKEFGEPGHVMLMRLIDKKNIPLAIKAFVKKIKENKNYLWTNDIIFVLGESQRKEDINIVRQQFKNFAVRNAVLLVLAEKAKMIDREKFVAGLSTSSLNVLTACCNALQKLPPSKEGVEQLALLKTLQQLGKDESEYPVREKVVQLLRRNSGKTFGFLFGKKGYHPQSKVIAAWFDWVTTTYPQLAKVEKENLLAEQSQLQNLMLQVDWKLGNIEAGKKIFYKRGCIQCHGGQRALGPNLAGVAQRFSRKDLLTAIIFPSKDVSSRYRTTLVETTTGKVYTGLIIYQSVDGLLLRNASGQTFRIEAKEIESQRLLKTSLMPNGLLKELSSQNLANLDAYLNSLKKEKK